MKNSINYKLSGGFGLCVLLLLAVVGFNISALQKLDKLYNEAAKRAGEMQIAMNAQFIGKDLEQIIGNVVINRDIVKTELLWAACKETSMAKLQKLAEIADTPEEHTLIREAQAAISDIFRIHEEGMLPLIMGGKAVPGHLVDKDARLNSRIEDFEQLLLQIARSISNENRAASEEYHQLLTITIKSGLAISLLGVLAALAVAALTTRRIVRPLSEITQATMEITRGNYRVDLNYRSDDELGALANNFREMSGQVEKRASELQESNESLQREIREHKQAEEAISRLNANLERQVDARTAELRNLSQHLQTVREEERVLISRDIHDELGQLLTALKIDVLWLRSKLPGEPRQLFEKTIEMEKYFDRAISVVKRISAELRPALLNELGLTAAIEWHAQEFQKRAGINCEVKISCDCGALDLSRSTALFRIFQETLTNICRHAEATKVEVTLVEIEEELIVTMTDNGKGIAERQLTNPMSLGLIGMRERARNFGGAVTIGRSPNGGTSVQAVIPLDGREKETSRG